MKSAKMMSGWFTQEGMRINMNPDNPDPILYYAREGEHYRFNGMITFKDPHTFSGVIEDRCGTADIHGTLVGEKILFSKKYRNRNDTIEYELDFYPGSENVWCGIYKGAVVGKGEARIILTDVPSDFFRRKR